MTKKGGSKPFQRTNEQSALNINGTNCFDALMVITSTDKMLVTKIPQEALPYLILAKREDIGTIEVVSAAMCSFTQQPKLLKPVLLLRLLQPKIMEK